jgi:hypothetical protein
MKINLNYLIGIICLIIISCDNENYDYLGEDTIFVFKLNDTLVFNGINKNDTFVVSSNYKSTMIADKTNYFETLDIGLKELTFDCKGENYNYCGGMSIRRQGSSFTSFHFRNIDYFLNKTNSTTISYKFHSGKILPNVLKINFTIPVQVQNKDIGILYYIPKYGIIAYSQINSDFYEIDNSRIN